MTTTTEPASLADAEAPRADSTPPQEVAGSLAGRQATLIPSSTKTAALVLGMHSSGTSSVAGALVGLGAKAPKSLMGPDSINVRGYFESVALMRLNDEILASAGSVWDDWRSFNEEWAASAEAGEWEAKGVATLTQEYDDGSFIAVKDPRISRMLPFWMRIFDRAGYAVRVLLPVRSPLEVARSLRTRNGFFISKGLLLWLRHILDAEAASRHLPRAIFQWPDFLTDWQATMARAAEQTGLIWPNLCESSIAEIEQFISSELRHEVAEAEATLVHPEINDWVQATYCAMTALAKDPTSPNERQTLDDVRAEFGRASKLFGRLFVDIEENVARILAYAVEARTEADKFSQQAASERNRADTLCAERDFAVAERDALAEQLKAVCAERDRLATDAAEQQFQADARAAERDLAIAERTALSGRLAAVCAEVARLAAAVAAQRIPDDAATGDQPAVAASEKG
ncbi:MAG: hypothetical protein U1E20_04545 [Methylocystis sp.]|uniref:sulfotransferase family protein n=1 Tax=Methylocystis sp. TaxID=1911079 RepID=UPI0039438C45